MAAPDGTILDYGRHTRTVSDSLFDTLVIRDHGCRSGGCPVGPDGCDAHHAVHWGDDGTTEPDNLILQPDPGAPAAPKKRTAKPKSAPPKTAVTDAAAAPKPKTPRKPKKADPA